MSVYIYICIYIYIYIYNDYISFIKKQGEESLKEVSNEINSTHPTIKSTADWLEEKVNFLNVEVTLKNGALSTDLFVKAIDKIQFLYTASCQPYQKAYPLVRHKDWVAFATIVVEDLYKHW